jgi:hypothetical protein
MTEQLPVTEPNRVKETRRNRTTSGSCWLAFVVLLLWGINGVNIQSVVHELSTTVAISQHRLERLLALQGKYIPNTGTQIVRCAATVQNVSDSELRTVHLRMRAISRRELARTEEALELATAPKLLSQECENVAKELRQAKWERESWVHTSRVLHADHERSCAQQGVSTERPVYRLVGLKTSQLDLPPELERELTKCNNRIVELERSLELATSKSKGFLSFTGSKKQYPVVDAIGWWRLSVLSIMASACWYFLSLCLKPGFVFTVKPFSLRSALQRLRAKKATMETQAGQSLAGIPCLGTIVISSEPMLIQVSSFSPLSGSKDNHSNERQVINVRTYAIVLARLLLSLWIAFFASRLLMDESWRELFFASPLAGLSRLVGGVI